MEYLVQTFVVDDSTAGLTQLAQEGWQVHSMELTGTVTVEQAEVPIFTFLLHRMLPQPQEQEKPRAMAMKG